MNKIQDDKQAHANEMLNKLKALEKGNPTKYDYINGLIDGLTIFNKQTEGVKVNG